MVQNPEQFVQLGKSNFEAVLTLANITLESAEQLVDLQLKAARQTLDQSIRGVQSLTGAKNVQDLMSLQSHSAQPNVEQALAYSRSLYEVASSAQARINKVVGARISAMNSEFMAALEKAAKAAPAGSDTAFTAFRSALAAATNAYDTLTHVAPRANGATAHAAARATKPAKKKAH